MGISIKHYVNGLMTIPEYMNNPIHRLTMAQESFGNLDFNIKEVQNEGFELLLDNAQIPQVALGAGS